MHWHHKHKENLTLGQRIADYVAATMGSWRFIIIQSGILAIWVMLNVTAFINHWDPYPFILLNLALSFQAAYAAPFIMISQNRQAERDRRHAEEDYQTNLKAKEEIEALQIHLHRIEADKLNKILDMIEDVHDHVERRKWTKTL
jgi:uncharacterized membrane protein